VNAWYINSFLVTFTICPSQISILDRDEVAIWVFLLVKLMSHVVVGRGTQVMCGVGEFEIYVRNFPVMIIVVLVFCFQDLVFLRLSPTSWLN
jgi:hypothetical protein